MSERYWDKDRGPWILGLSLLAIALTLAVIFVGFSYVYESVYHDHATSERRSSAQQQFDEECSGITTVKKLTACFEEKIHGYGEAQRSQEDLHAQKKMAQWAFWMLLVTGAVGVFTVLVTGVGVFYVARTLRATSDTLKAAQEANEIMRLEQRPWVVVDPERKCAFQIAKGTQFTLQFRYKLVNIGGSPAFDVHAYYKVFQRDHISERDFNIDQIIEETNDPSNFRFGEPVIFPNRKAKTNRIGIGELITGTGDDFFLLVCITYRGAGITDRAHEFRVFWIGDHPHESEDEFNENLGTSFLIEHGRLRAIG